MKLISWNVNGIRSVLKKGFLDVVQKENPDILCIQETKATPADVTVELAGYEQFWNSAVKKGYSGTAVFSCVKPLDVLYGFGKNEHDGEGRVITLEYPNYYLVNVYTPNAKRELLRLPYRQEWDREFRIHITSLEKKKPVIFCGDLNVAHTEIDLARPQDNRYNPGFTDEEREGFSEHLSAGYIDSFRELEKGVGHYSWWSYMFNAREKNIGWRIDYVCLSKKLQSKLKKAWIMPSIYGSDHCPVAAEVD